MPHMNVRLDGCLIALGSVDTGAQHVVAGGDYTVHLGVPIPAASVGVDDFVVVPSDAIPILRVPAQIVITEGGRAETALIVRHAGNALDIPGIQLEPSARAALYAMAREELARHRAGRLATAYSAAPMRFLETHLPERVTEVLERWDAGMRQRMPVLYGVDRGEESRTAMRTRLSEVVYSGRVLDDEELTEAMQRVSGRVEAEVERMAQNAMAGVLYGGSTGGFSAYARNTSNVPREEVRREPKATTTRAYMRVVRRLEIDG